MTKHYTTIENEQPVEVSRRLPRFLVRLSNGAKCWSPASVEAQGRLHEYGIAVFDSVPATLGAFDTQAPLTVDDVKMVDGKPTGTHRKNPPPTTIQLRRLLFAEGQDLLRRSDWTQAADYVERHEIKARRWNVWRHGVRQVVKALKAGTQDPRTVTWDDPPEPLEDTIE